MAKAKLRSEVAEEGKVIHGRKVSEILLQAQKEGVESVAGTLSQQEVKAVVDEIYGMDVGQKQVAKTVTLGKELLREYAKKHGEHEVVGTVAMARASDSTSVTVTASKVIKYLEKTGNMKLLDTILSVSITEFKKYLGSDVLSKLGEMDVTPFKSISLKALKDA